MQKQKAEIRMPLIVLILIIVWIIFTIFIATTFGIQNKHHRDKIEIHEDVIEIYEEYYVLDEEMDLIYRFWRDWYPQYEEEEFYIKYYPETYLRYLKLKKIIGEFEK